MNINEYNAQKREQIERRNNPLKDFGIVCDKLLFGNDENKQECGGRMMVDTSQSFTSNPPKYQTTCDKCGNVDYVLQ